MTSRWPSIPALSLLLAACASTQLAKPVAEMQVAAADTPEAAGMVDIRTLVPDIDLEMRYASDNNFVGTRVDGYEAARCFLQVPAARALARVESALRREHRRLRIYDCYRPARAVRHFVAWAGDLADQRTKPRYYPNLDKRELLGDYISPTSGHSRGATLDLSLMRCASADDASTCTALDMGTPFDYFDVSAHTDWPGATSVQRENRQRLLAAMSREGFANYPLEWWHYTYKPEPTPQTAYDFPLR